MALKNRKNGQKTNIGISKTVKLCQSNHLFSQQLVVNNIESLESSSRLSEKVFVDVHNLDKLSSPLSMHKANARKKFFQSRIYSLTFCDLWV